MKKAGRLTTPGSPPPSGSPPDMTEHTMNRDYYHLRDVWIYRVHHGNSFSSPGGRFLVLLPPVQTINRTDGLGLSTGRVSRSSIVRVEILDEQGVRLGTTSLSPGQCGAQGRRIFNHTQLPQAVATAAEALAVEHIGKLQQVRWVRTDINKWLSSRQRNPARGAPMGYTPDKHDYNLPFHVEALRVDKGGYLTDGTYYGLRVQGQKPYAVYQDGETRRIIMMRDAATSGEVIAHVRAHLGLDHFRDI